MDSINVEQSGENASEANDTKAIGERLAQVTERIRSAERASGRPIGSVQLLAVSKAQSLSSLQGAISAGQDRFGENYLQEAIPKIEQLSQGHEPPLEWHFIGKVQSNKIKPIAEHFQWVQSVDSVKIAQRLSEQRPDNMPPLNVCLQVNISAEPNKAGVLLKDLNDLVKVVAPLPRLTLRGLMTIPKAGSITADSAKPYEHMYQAFQQIQKSKMVDEQFNTLSMGMTEDFEVAIAHGATLVRVGTGIFGPRHHKETP